MAKVSEAHLEARRQQILEAARTCFARKGFHQATMQDLCLAAGLSPGAISRYFLGKDAIIDALCAGDLERLTAQIAGVRELGSFTAAVDAMVEQFYTPFLAAGAGLPGSPAAIEIELIAEALRNPAVGDRFHRFLDGARAAFAALVRDAQ